jgi:hypothetical protein
MAEQNIDIKIKVDKQGNVELKSLEKGFDKVKITAKQASQAAKQLGVDISQIKSSGSINVAANDFNKLSKAMSGASAASGGATASVLELGRVVSDAPYGIRGVANNLQQLASNFAFMAKEAGSAGGALKSIGSALMGPLGILVAFQAVIAAIDYFSAQTNKAEKNVKSMNETIAAAASNFKILLRAQEDNTLGLEEARESVRRINSQYKDLNVQLDENGRLTDASVQAIEKKIIRLEDLAKATAIQTLVEEKYGEVVLKTLEIEEANFKLNTKIAEATALRAKADKDALEGAVSRENRVEQMALSAEKSVDFMVDKVKELTKERGKQQEEISKLIKMIPNIGDLFTMKTEGGSTKAILKQQLLDLSKIILDAYRKENLLLEENELEQMKIKQKYEREEIGRRRDMFLERQKQRYDDFMKKAKTDEQRAQATKVWQDSQIQADSEYYEALSALGIKHTAEKHVKMLELERNFAEELVNQRLARIKADESRLASLRAGAKAGALNRPMSAVGAEDIEGQNEMARDRMAAEQANFEDDLERKIENLKRQGHSLLEAEQMVAGERHAFQMSQAEQEIELERNKIEAKRNINQEYISWFSGLGSIMKGIAGDNEALATAALVLEKGAAISGIIVKTQAANAAIGTSMLTEQGAYQAAAAGFTAMGNYAASATALKKSVVAGVLGKKRILKNNIGAGISIAKIAATTLQSRGAGGGGAGGGGDAGGGAPSREFDFNLVGSTGVNQLAQGVGAQFSQQPIQAYVVSSQMTSQQQLDHTIQTQASIGD